MSVYGGADLCGEGDRCDGADCGGRECDRDTVNKLYTARAMKGFPISAERMLLLQSFCLLEVVDVTPHIPSNFEVDSTNGRGGTIFLTLLFLTYPWSPSFGAQALHLFVMSWTLPSKCKWFNFSNYLTPT